MKNRKASSSGVGGFTLLETLVALVVLAITLSVVMELFSGGLRSARLSKDYTRAALYGREKMEEILSAKSLEEGKSEGDLKEGFRWKAVVSRLEPPEEEAEKTPFHIYRVRLSILWGDQGKEKSFDLSTMKITGKAKEG